MAWLGNAQTMLTDAVSLCTLGWISYRIVGYRRSFFWRPDEYSTPIRRPLSDREVAGSGATLMGWM